MALKDAPSICPTLLIPRRIIWLLLSVSPTTRVSDYPNPLYFSVFLLHLSNSSQRSFGHSKYILSVFSLRLDISMVDWTPRLDGALDVSSRRCIGRFVSMVDWTQSKGPKESYKYDLANSLVPLIALSLDHQNHSKRSK